MKCPYCGNKDTEVRDSRPSREGTAIRRRRHCPKCNGRFTTFERVQLKVLNVIKRNGEMVPFDPQKLFRSLQIALRKRSVPVVDVDRAVVEIEQKLAALNEEEVTSQRIGDEALSALATLDKVAYVRYASVYQDFTEIGDFADFIRTEPTRDKDDGKSQHPSIGDN
ncbi:MAG: transcriptional regulator NrdR [Pseudomonadota bacterium]